VRILTPLLKFRACRDARKVTGDAMEVRGGCGYIEEWSDARLLRDAHLGSIWEGTSNIVALDVLRAIRKEDALSALPFLDAKAVEFGKASNEENARQAASGLYYAAAAAILKQEGEALARNGDARRLLLAKLVEDHKLSTRDPFEAKDCPFAEALLSEEKIPLEQARSWLN
jgi:acyl-CoA dehydrogenase